MPSPPGGAAVTSQIGDLAGVREAVAAPVPAFARLQTLPGVGPTVAALRLAEIGAIAGDRGAPAWVDTQTGRSPAGCRVECGRVTAQPGRQGPPRVAEDRNPEIGDPHPDPGDGRAPAAPGETDQGNPDGPAPLFGVMS
jgi:hypothetical protein